MSNRKDHGIGSEGQRDVPLHKQKQYYDSGAKHSKDKDKGPTISRHLESSRGSSKGRARGSSPERRGLPTMMEAGKRGQYEVSLAKEKLRERKQELAGHKDQLEQEIVDVRTGVEKWKKQLETMQNVGIEPLPSLVENVKGVIINDEKKLKDVEDQLVALNREIEENDSSIAEQATVELGRAVEGYKRAVTMMCNVAEGEKDFAKAAVETAISQVKECLEDFEESVVSLDAVKTQIKDIDSHIKKLRDQDKPKEGQLAMLRGKRKSLENLQSFLEDSKAGVKKRKDWEKSIAEEGVNSRYLKSIREESGSNLGSVVLGIDGSVDLYIKDLKNIDLMLAAEKGLTEFKRQNDEFLNTLEAWRATFRRIPIISFLVTVVLSAVEAHYYKKGEAADKAREETYKVLNKMLGISEDEIEELKLIPARAEMELEQEAIEKSKKREAVLLRGEEEEARSAEKAERKARLEALDAAKVEEARVKAAAKEEKAKAKEARLAAEAAKEARLAMEAEAKLKAVTQEQLEAAELEIAKLEKLEAEARLKAIEAEVLAEKAEIASLKDFEALEKSKVAKAKKESEVEVKRTNAAWKAIEAGKLEVEEAKLKEAEEEKATIAAKEKTRTAGQLKAVVEAKLETTEQARLAAIQQLEQKQEAEQRLKVMEEKFKLILEGGVNNDAEMEDALLFCINQFLDENEILSKEASTELRKVLHQSKYEIILIDPFLRLLEKIEAIKDLRETDNNYKIQVFILDLLRVIIEENKIDNAKNNYEAIYNLVPYLIRIAENTTDNRCSIILSIFKTIHSDPKRYLFPKTIEAEVSFLIKILENPYYKDTKEGDKAIAILSLIYSDLSWGSNAHSFFNEARAAVNSYTAGKVQLVGNIDIKPPLEVVDRSESMTAPIPTIAGGVSGAQGAEMQSSEFTDRDPFIRRAVQDLYLSGYQFRDQAVYSETMDRIKEDKRLTNIEAEKLAEECKRIYLLPENEMSKGEKADLICKITEATLKDLCLAYVFQIDAKPDSWIDEVKDLHLKMIMEYRIKAAHYFETRKREILSELAKTALFKEYYGNYSNKLEEEYIQALYDMYSGDVIKSEKQLPFYKIHVLDNIVKEIGAMILSSQGTFWAGIQTMDDLVGLIKGLNLSKEHQAQLILDAYGNVALAPGESKAFDEAIKFLQEVGMKEALNYKVDLNNKVADILSRPISSGEKSIEDMDDLSEFLDEGLVSKENVRGVLLHYIGLCMDKDKDVALKAKDLFNLYLSRWLIPDSTTNDLIDAFSESLQLGVLASGSKLRIMEALSVFLNLQRSNVLRSNQAEIIEKYNQLKEQLDVYCERMDLACRDMDRIISDNIANGISFEEAYIAPMEAASNFIMSSFSRSETTTKVLLGYINLFMNENEAVALRARELFNQSLRTNTVVINDLLDAFLYHLQPGRVVSDSQKLIIMEALTMLMGKARFDLSNPDQAGSIDKGKYDELSKRLEEYFLFMDATIIDTITAKVSPDNGNPLTTEERIAALKVSYNFIWSTQANEKKKFEVLLTYINLLMDEDKEVALKAEDLFKQYLEEWLLPSEVINNFMNTVSNYLQSDRLMPDSKILVMNALSVLIGQAGEWKKEQPGSIDEGKYNELKKLLKEHRRSMETTTTTSNATAVSSSSGVSVQPIIFTEDEKRSIRRAVQEDYLKQSLQVSMGSFNRFEMDAVLNLKNECEEIYSKSESEMSAAAKAEKICQITENTLKALCTKYSVSIGNNSDGWMDSVNEGDEAINSNLKAIWGYRMRAAEYFEAEKRGILTELAKTALFKTIYSFYSSATETDFIQTVYKKRNGDVIKSEEELIGYKMKTLSDAVQFAGIEMLGGFFYGVLQSMNDLIALIKQSDLPEEQKMQLILDAHKPVEKKAKRGDYPALDAVRDYFEEVQKAREIQAQYFEGAKKKILDELMTTDLVKAIYNDYPKSIHREYRADVIKSEEELGNYKMEVLDRLVKKLGQEFATAQTTIIDLVTGQIGYVYGPKEKPSLDDSLNDLVELVKKLNLPADQKRQLLINVRKELGLDQPGMCVALDKAIEELS